MEQKVMYRVVAAGGKYDQAWASTLAASFDRARCEAFIAEKEAEDKEIHQLRASLVEYYSAWFIKNPQLLPGYPEAVRAQAELWSAAKVAFLAERKTTIADFNLRIKGLATSYHITELIFLA